MPDGSKDRKRWRRVVLILATPILLVVGLFAFAWIVQWAIDARTIILGEAQRVVVQIDRDSAIAREARWQMSRMRAAFLDAGIDVDGVAFEGATVRVFGVPESNRAVAQAIVAERLPEWAIDDASDPWQITLPDSHEEQIARSAFARTGDVLSERLRQLGARIVRVKEPRIENLRFEITFKMLDGGSSVVDDLRFANTAILEVREVAGQGWLDGSGMPALITGNARSAKRSETSAGIEACQAVVDESGRIRSWPTIAAPIVSGSDFEHCYRSANEWGDPVLNCLLSDEAKGRLWAFTSANVGREMALVEWDEGGCRALLVPRIEEPFGDSVVFGGMRDEWTADDLAFRIRAGRVPARVSISH
jgi:preprotein translocase subunit SecD